jgi:hypothetical protein
MSLLNVTKGKTTSHTILQERRITTSRHLKKRHIKKVFVELKRRKQVENIAVFVELKKNKVAFNFLYAYWWLFKINKKII